MWWTLKNLVFLTIACFTSIFGLIRLKKMDKAFKLLALYTLITFIVEALAIAIAANKGNNLVLYNLYSIVEFFLLLQYYFNALKTVQTRIRIGITILGICFAVINLVFFQSINNNLVTNFIVFESFTFVIFSLYSFYVILSDDRFGINNTVFWTSAILLIYWSFTFFYWLVGVAFFNSTASKPIWLDAMIMSINILSYIGFGILFIAYPKMKQNEL